MTWKHIDAKHLLAKHGKIGIDKSSIFNNSTIDNIANTMDTSIDITYNIPEKYKCNLINQFAPIIRKAKNKAQIIDPVSTEIERYINNYIKRNGSL